MTALTGTRVLIVEDETIIAMTAEDLLADNGLEVVAVAESLEAGLAAADAGGFDVALLDVNLHGRQSLPIAELLRGRGIPFLFTTGYGSAGPGAVFADAPLVTKPYGADDLLAGLLRALA